MASSGPMAEFARLPVQRKVLLFAVIGGVLGLGYWKLVYTALDEQLDAAQAEHDAKLRTQDRLAKDLPKYQTLRTRVATLRDQIEKNQAALPNEAEVPAFFETLQHKVAESGGEIRKWTNRNEEPVESFVKVPVEIEMTGTFMQIKRFFASLIQRDVRASPAPGNRANQERERIVSIENLALNSPTVKNREVILTAKFTAVTFRQEDKPATPDKPATGQPAAAGAAQPPASNPPNLPATPVPATPSSPASPALPSSSPGAPPLPSATPAPGAKPPAAGGDRLKGGF